MPKSKYWKLKQRAKEKFSNKSKNKHSSKPGDSFSVKGFTRELLTVEEISSLRHVKSLINETFVEKSIYWKNIGGGKKRKMIILNEHFSKNTRQANVCKSIYGLVKEILESRYISYEWNEVSILKSTSDELKEVQRPHTDYKNGSNCAIAFIGLMVSMYS